jgi:hypothetical protein
LRLASAGNSYGGEIGDMSASTSTMSADAVALRDRIRKETEY